MTKIQHEFSLFTTQRDGEGGQRGRAREMIFLPSQRDDTGHIYAIRIFGLLETEIPKSIVKSRNFVSSCKVAIIKH